MPEELLAIASSKFPGENQLRELIFTNARSIFYVTRNLPSPAWGLLGPGASGFAILAGKEEHVNPETVNLDALAASPGSVSVPHDALAAVHLEQKWGAMPAIVFVFSRQAGPRTVKASISPPLPFIREYGKGPFKADREFRRQFREVLRSTLPPTVRLQDDWKV